MSDGNSNIEKICRIKDPLNWSPEKSALMVEAVKESAKYHYANNSSFKLLLDDSSLSVDSISSEEDIKNLPAISVFAMKNHLLLSDSPDNAVLKMTSSGTSGLKTQSWMNQESVDRAQAMLRSIWEQENLVSTEPTNYLLFVYNPNQAKDLGVAFSAKNRTQFAPPHKVEYAINQNESGDWEFDKKRVYEILIEYQKSGLPVRILGITGFIYEFIDFLNQNAWLKMPNNSFVFTTGGWKAAEDKKVTREVFQEQASQRLGIPIQNIRDGFGMAEHGAPYWQCSHHRLHVPAFCRVVVVEPVNLKPLSDGEFGLLKLITPYNTMMPNLSILTTDMGRIHSDPCPCGWSSPSFEISGRAGLSKNKGCAIHADEIVKRSL